mmetsp:Transcript_19454/g.44275  ORF Transcript_19454/g.44275 Transcript_19454/m.44275 type:complete len:561 (-) Transcript_19454:152-1834(-)
MEVSSFSKLVTAKFAEIQEALTSEHNREVDGVRRMASNLQAELSDLQSRSGFADILKSEIHDLRSARAAEKENASNEVHALKLQVANLQESQESERQRSTKDAEAFKAEIEELRQSRLAQLEESSGEVRTLKEEITELKRVQSVERQDSYDEVASLKAEVEDLRSQAEAQSVEAAAAERALKAEIQEAREKAVAAEAPGEAEELKVQIEKLKEAQAMKLRLTSKRMAAMKAEMDELKEQLGRCRAGGAPAPEPGPAGLERQESADEADARAAAAPASREDKPPSTSAQQAPHASGRAPQALLSAPAKGGAARRSTSRCGAFSRARSARAEERDRTQAGASETPKAKERLLDSKTPVKESKLAGGESEDVAEPEDQGERPLFQAERGFAGAVFGDTLRADLGDGGADDVLEELGKVMSSLPLNAAFKVGMKCEVLGTIMRRDESLMSPKVCRLEPGTTVEVLEIGTGPTGKRIKVMACSGGAVRGMRGWISTVSGDGVNLLTPLKDDDDTAACKESEEGGVDAPIASVDDILGGLNLQDDGLKEDCPEMPARPSAFDRCAN